LQERIRKFNSEEINRKAFISLLKERLTKMNIEQVKNDVKPYIKDLSSLDIWSNDDFL